MRIIAALALAISQAPGASRASSEVGIEYIGHAAFAIESPGGHRVVIDPFNGKRWLGYGFPDRVEADAVLITHPHYDHDASYYLGDKVPVFREPGAFRVGDLTLVGIEGRHADPYGKDFGQTNTIWVVETGGLRIVHLGDNGPLTSADLSELGRVDVLMIPIDGTEHILKKRDIAAIRATLKPPILVPMHYRLDGFLGLPSSLGPIHSWVEEETGVERLGRHVTQLSRPRAGSSRILVFEPSPHLRAWPEGLARGWQKLDQARALTEQDPGASAAAAALVREAYESGDSIVFAFQWARALRDMGRATDAVLVLERALAGAARDDWEYRMRSHSLLADLYAAGGRKDAAVEQQRIVLQGSYRLELIEKAKSYLSQVASGEVSVP